MARCLILGGNGFIGTHLAVDLVDKGHDVAVFDKFKNNIAKLKNKKIDVITGDYLKRRDISEALRDTDYLFHMISTTTPLTSIKDPVFDVESNVIGSIRLLEEAVKNDVERVIFSSSGGTIYGDPISVPISEESRPNPTNPYSISKYAIEQYLNFFQKTNGLEYLILRYSNPYGEFQHPDGKQGVIPIFLDTIRKGKQPIVYGDGDSVRDYIYIKDAVDATTKIFEKKTKERIFNIGSGSGTSLNDLIRIMSDVTGKRIVPKYRRGPRVYVSRIVLDISRIRNEIEWRPRTPLDEGMRRTWDWIKIL